MPSNPSSLESSRPTPMAESPSSAVALSESAPPASVLKSIEPYRADERLTQSRFMKACRGEPVDCTPLWIMRQAGRYLPEYRAVRSRVTFLDLCYKPELAAEVTLDAQRVLGVDAAILFADLLPILQPMGFDLEYAAGEGPIIHNPLLSAADLARVKEVEDPQAMSFTYEAVRQIRRQLPGDIPLLGFAGLPFTLASYAIEGSGSKHYSRTKKLMYSDRGAWHELLSRLARSVVRYVNEQVAAGCQAIQLFDSWVGCLSVEDYREYVQPYSRMVIEGVSAGTPVIHFTTGNPALLPLVREAGGSVIGLDWRCNLTSTWDQLGNVSVQGNLDPIVLNSREEMLRQTRRMLESVRSRKGYIFNLGHGVLPETPADNVKELVQFVHAETAGTYSS